MLVSKKKCWSVEQPSMCQMTVANTSHVLALLIGLVALLTTCLLIWFRGSRSAERLLTYIEKMLYIKSYIHLRMYACTYTHIHIYIPTWGLSADCPGWSDTHRHIGIHTHTYTIKKEETPMHVCMHIYTYTCIYPYMRTLRRLPRMKWYKQAHRYTHTHIHIQEIRGTLSKNSKLYLHVCSQKK